MSEVWCDIHDFNDYQVSDMGRVRSKNRLDSLGRRWTGKILKNARICSRYLRIRLQKNNETYDLLVHLLVLRAFKGPRPVGMQGCHNDGNTSINTLKNLRWDTPSNNHLDKIKHGTIARGSRNGSAKLSESQVKYIWGSNLSAPKLAVELGVHKETIARIRRSERWGWFTSKLEAGNAE